MLVSTAQIRGLIFKVRNVRVWYEFTKPINIARQRKQYPSVYPTLNIFINLEKNLIKLKPLLASAS